MIILQTPITIEEVKKLSAISFNQLVKAVVDVEQEKIAINAELHSDLEALLLENKSKQENLWGINLYPDMEGEDFIEFDSMINLRPTQGNRTRGVDSPEIQKKIISIVNKWVKQ